MTQERRTSSVKLGDCETCGGHGEPMTICMDTYFCPECWKDFGTERWKGIGSRLPKEEVTDV